MIGWVGLVVVIGGGGLFWFSEYGLPHGPAWRGTLLTGISAYLLIAGLLMIVFGGLGLTELACLVIPTLITALIGPLTWLDNGRNPSPFQFSGDQRAAKPKRAIIAVHDDDEWPWPVRRHGAPYPFDQSPKRKRKSKSKRKNEDVP